MLYKLFTNLIHDVHIAGTVKAYIVYIYTNHMQVRIKALYADKRKVNCIQNLRWCEATVLSAT